MSTLLILLLSLLIITFFLFKIGDAFSPWMITCMVWLAILVLFVFNGHLLYPLQSRFYTCLFIWVPILCTTSIITYYAFDTEGIYCNNYKNLFKTELHDIGYIEINQRIFDILFLVSMVFTPLYFYQTYKVIVMFGTEDLFSNIRILANAGERDFITTILSYVSSLNQALFIIELWNYPKGSKWRLTAIILANLLCAFAIMEKGMLFFLFFTTLFILYEKKKIKLVSIVFWAVIIIFLFYGINELRTSDDSKNETTFLDFFNIYILSPPVAFEQVQEKLTDQYGSRTFAFFYAVIKKLGIADVIVQPKLQEFVQVPTLTNVYTVFQPFYEDFGYKGVAFFSSVYGFFTGWLYRQLKDGKAISKCLYAYIVEVLVLQFYQENLILSLSMLIQYLAVFVLVLQQRIHFSFRAKPHFIKKA